MMRNLQKSIKLSAVLCCIAAFGQASAQTNLLTINQSFELGSGVGPGSTLNGQWTRTNPNDQNNVANYIYKQGLANTMGAPLAKDGNYYLEAVTPNNSSLYNAYDKLYTQNSQNLLDLTGISGSGAAKGKTFRVFFDYQNTVGHSFKAWVRTSNGANIGELVINTEAADWTQTSFDYIVPSGIASTAINLRLEFGLNAGTTRIDNVRIYDVATLPVKIKSFNIAKEAHSVKLNWETTDELDNNYFELLRSSDGVNYISLQIIKGKNKSTVYGYEDLNPLTGINYYKLMQYDLNGNSSIIDVKVVKFGMQNQKASVYPNPFSNILTIEKDLTGAKNISVKLMDTSGKVIKSQSFNGIVGYNLFSLQTGDMLSGLYTLLIESNGKTEAVKLNK